MNPPPVTLDDIRAAQQRISDRIYHSPCPHSLNLSRHCDAQIYCKLDHLQPTGSFKERGARNKLKLLPDRERAAGVITASAGNHALALAFHGRDLGIGVTVVMPRWAPLVKLANTRSFGAEVILHGESYDEARRHALSLAQERGKTFVHGFDDPAIIAGQGTLGLEILEDVPDLDAVVVPVGGGGLIGGIATAIKSLKPSVRVIGVEPVFAPTLHASLQAGQITRIETRPTLADGLAIAEVGKLCFDLARRFVDEVMLVDEAQIALSVLRLLELEKTVVEGAGAVPLAAAMDRSRGLAGKKVVLVLCGGNIDINVIARVIERGLASDGRLCRVQASISDRPGSLAALLAVVASTGASVKEVSHDRNFGPADVWRVGVSLIAETRDFDHIAKLRAALESAGVQVHRVDPS